MRKLRGIVAVSVLGIAAAWSLGAATRKNELTPAASEENVEVYFSPAGGCTEAIIKEIEQAKKTIHVQAYYFTSSRLAKALTDAKKRGVAVEIVLDKSAKTDKYTDATFFLDAGIPTYIDEEHAVAHNKVMLLDGQTIITGSFNFTTAAEKSNAENLLILRGKKKLFAAYEANYQEHLKHSSKYTR